MLKNQYLRVSESMRAECSDDTRAHWHLLKVAPQNERIAAAHLWGRMHKFTASEHLVSRGFGVYAPEITIKTGRPLRDVRQPMFPGWLFVFVWGLEHHARRIVSCPGVIRIVYDGEKPAIVPDYLINYIQMIEGINGRKRRARKRWRKENITPEEESLVISCYSALDEQPRTGLLHHALGIE